MINYRLFIPALLAFCALPLAAQDGISIGGGTLYTEWPTEMPSMPGVITIATDHREIRRRPSQVILLIDASTSMEGTPAQMAREAAESALNNLADEDLLGIVTFAGVANSLTAMEPLAPANRQSVKSAAGRIMTQPGRDLSSGLREAANQFARFAQKEAGSRLILVITNGVPDRGIVDRASLLALADSVSLTTGAAISTLGYDRHIDEQTLIGIAEASAGRALFIEEEEAAAIPRVVGREVARCAAVRGTDARLSLRLPEGCIMSQLCGARDLDGQLALPALPDNDTLRIFFELSPMPDSRSEIEVELSWTDPSSNSRQTLRTLLDFPLPQGGSVLNEKTAPLLTAYLQRRTLGDNAEAISGDRRAVAVALDDTLKILEQESIRYNGQLDEVIGPLRLIQKELANNTVDTEVMIKRLQYEHLRILYGY